MIDRANAAIRQILNNEDGSASYIYLHTRFKGSVLPSIIKSALIRGKTHWDREEYFSFILFSEMTKDNINDLVGFGISTTMPDHGHQNLYIDPQTKTIKIGKKSWTYDDFIAQEDSILNHNF